MDTNGETSIKRLYALGETSCTGLHGANRLASNSLIEAVVYADQAAKHAASQLASVEIQEGIPDWDFEGTQHTEEMLMIIQSKREMQTLMSNYVGIVRSNLSLKRAHAAAGNPVAGDRGALQQDQAQPRTVRTAQHDRRGLSGHQAGPRNQGVGRLPLQCRLPEGELRIAAGGTAPGTPRNKTDTHSVT